MKTNKYVEDLQAKSVTELAEELTAAKKELFNLRFQNESPLFIYAAVCQVELKVLADNQIVRDSYKKGYDSIIIFEGMIAQFHEMARNLFNGTKYERSDEEYRSKALTSRL